MYKLNIIRFIILALLATAWLWTGACSGSSADNPGTPGPGGNVTETMGTLKGTLIDREGYPLGGFDTQVWVTNAEGISVAPTINPPGSGPEAGQFIIQNLPVGQLLYFEAEHVDQSIGRNLGYKQDIFFNGPGTLDLGKVMLDNPWLKLGWDSYKQKDYTQALIYFQRSINSRKLSAAGFEDFTLSSSAYNGLAWVHAKRGKDNQGSGNPMFPGFEWDQALAEWGFAISNFNDADAWVGKGGVLFSLLADVHTDPVQVGPFIPMYGLVHPHFTEIYECMQKALLAAPDYFCEHDLIQTNDLKAVQLFLTWVMGGNVTLNDVENFVEDGGFNEGSAQLLAIMPDLLLYDPYPQR
jgi:tetratricopeptide (TPR) repeat protein